MKSSKNAVTEINRNLSYFKEIQKTSLSSLPGARILATAFVHALIAQWMRPCHKPLFSVKIKIQSRSQTYSDKTTSRSLQVEYAVYTWQTPYVMYLIDASVILSVTPGVSPRYRPRRPSWRVTSRAHCTPLWYRCGNVCIFTLSESSGWINAVEQAPPESQSQSQ